MNALSDPLTMPEAARARNTRGQARAPRFGSGSRKSRLVLREILRNWLGPLAIVAGLAACHQLGLFAMIDGRAFDFATANEPGLEPKVVIIERETGFAAEQTQSLTQLDSQLAALGVERIGYLGDAGQRAGGGPVPLVIAQGAVFSPASGTWKLDNGGQSTPGWVPAARTIAPSTYGINRMQSAQLNGREGAIPTFDVALSGQKPAHDDFYVRMSRRQSIPVLQAGQVLAGELQDNELGGTVALIAGPEAMRASLATPLMPSQRATSEALFRAHAIQTLRADRAVYPLRTMQAWLLLLICGVILAIIYRGTDPKRLALIIPVAATGAVAGGFWAALQFAGTLIPVTALLAAPWLVTFQRVLGREASQDRRLEQSASRAVQLSFRRSALREGARLPQFLGSAARYAGVERSLLVERHANGKLEALAAENASLDDVTLDRKPLNKFLDKIRRSNTVHDAGELVPSWEGEARIGSVGSGGQQLFWLHTRPETATPGKSAHLVRALVSSFRELFRWRSNLNARARQDERNLPVDERVASAIALVSNESEQIRRGFDTIDTAVVLFHLIGSPLHANRIMLDLYRDAGLSLFDASLPDVLMNLTEFDRARVDALIEDLMLNGGEMRLPMREIGSHERILRLAAPSRNARGSDRILVLEAVDIADFNRAADLRQAVAQFIDLQLRNDFEAILLGAQLAGSERLAPEKLGPVVSRIGETARRATQRLDEVAELVRAENRDLTETCYPIDASKVVAEAVSNVDDLAGELGVSIEQSLPGVSGFTIAEPTALVGMLVAMLRVVIADTPQGGTIKLELEELDGRTHIRVSGGFGIGFGRLMWLMTNTGDDAVGEFRIIREGMSHAVGWSASVSYWGREADGFGFNIDLRRIG
ncbi:hypothetical protein ACRAQ7_09735 [Erythrobacter sp. W53]|uniref:hypothetical protein n=1 Tax=Erythrobacter sp. W53 TaxID=3425947 RepID=UPI003D7675B1